MFTSKIIQFGTVAVIALGIFAGFTSSAEAVVRNCNYEIRVKANGINSVTIPNGRVVFKGRALNTNNDNGYARLNAAKAAHRCFIDAKSGRQPSSCRPKASTPRNSIGTAKRYSIPVLKQTGFNALCIQARILGISEVKNGKIYIFTKGGSGDVRRECSLPPSFDNVPPSSNGASTVPITSRYFTLKTAPAVICRNGEFVRIGR